MHTGILTAASIAKAVESGDIEIDPFTPEQVNVTSYDLTLGSQVSVYKHWVTEIANGSDGRYLRPRRQLSVYDVKREPETLDYEMDPELGWVLQPGIGYLMHTQERIRTVKYNPILDGKSSIGRLFLQVHATAGYGDPGFDGQYTLEVIVQHPIRVYPGMRICQIRFQTLFTDGVEIPQKTYDQVGHYKADKARGAVASQAWKQFRGK